MKTDKIIRDTKAALKRVDWDMKHVPKVCSAGCHYCCHQCVTLFEVEGFVLARHLETEISAEQRERFRQRAENWLENFDEVTRDADEANPIAEDELLAAEKAMNQRRIPCAFLEDGHCQVYEARPSSCRAHVVEDNREACKDISRTTSDAAMVVKVKHIKLFAQIGNRATIRPMMYAVAESLGIQRRLKPLALPVRATKRA